MLSERAARFGELDPRAVRRVGSIRLLDCWPDADSREAAGSSIELEREEDGRWLAEVPTLPGVMCYGADRDEAVARVQALALRVIAERLEHREAPAEFLNVTFQAARATGYPPRPGVSSRRSRELAGSKNDNPIPTSPPFDQTGRTSSSPFMTTRRLGDECLLASESALG